MLKNAPTLAIRGVDTDENEPSKVSMKWGSQIGDAPVTLCGQAPAVFTAAVARSQARTSRRDLEEYPKFQARTSRKLAERTAGAAKSGNI